MDASPQILIVCTDLIFSTKITGTAKALGKPFAVARTMERFVTLLAAAGEGTKVIVDMSVSAVDPVAAIRKAKEKSGVEVVAFLSHVEADTAVAAREAGADQVLARSAFSARLPELLGE